MCEEGYYNSSNIAMTYRDKKALFEKIAEQEDKEFRRKRSIAIKSKKKWDSK